MTGRPLFDIPFLASRWALEYKDFQESVESEVLLVRLRNWAAGGRLKETSSEASFVKQFFCETWSYAQEGDTADTSFQCWPQFSVDQAGQQGGTGRADLALGQFSKTATGSQIPQVLCEFKDIRSALDKRQYRKGNDRSPVEQCFSYLRGARTHFGSRELVEPYWAVVTDMNEFRLYCAKWGPAQCQCFVIEPSVGDEQESLLAETESAAFLRFLFWRLFHRSSLLTDRGPSYLQRLLDDQLVHEQTLEKAFYLEYKAYREELFRTIREANPDFTGTPGQLVRLTQRLLDRCLFIFFCEDMGLPLFPGDLLRDVLIDYSRDSYYHPEDTMPWERLKTIFTAMRDGGVFGKHEINRFNGGLFESLPKLENLRIPASVFCSENQGTGGLTTLLAHPLTLLYFSAKYNFGIKDVGQERVIDFYALGRIFEQSITELEIMEAEAEGRPSINLLSKRKRNGVYYTPEWITGYIVRETVGTRLDDIKTNLGLTPDRAPTDEDIAKYRRFLRDRRYAAPVAGGWIAGLDDYVRRLKQLRIVDPACGSGAFLIQALEYLKSEFRWIYEQREKVRGYVELWETDTITRAILKDNLYGVDINPESVEITKLALWMHTALPGKILSQLDHNIQCGNSLVGPDFEDFYLNKHASLFEELNETKRESINAFDWHAAFPEVFARDGFDCVIGNPPYVKLQNFRRVEEDMAEYLVQAEGEDGSHRYASTQAGNFDLYLPFIEKGVSLLRPEGRMGYIAPNVWMVNQYGKPLRQWIKKLRSLDRWIDFKSFQVFEEATTYTALQFFRGESCETVRCIFAPDGDVSATDWGQPDAEILYEKLPDDEAWVLLPDQARKLRERLRKTCRPLGSNEITTKVFQGMVTSANGIYHLHRELGWHVSKPKKGEHQKVEIECLYLRPLITGRDAKRYCVPQPSVDLLFPYSVSPTGCYLVPIDRIASETPLTYNYLKENEVILRKREYPKMDDDGKWWGYVYPKNRYEQSLPKIMIASTAPEIRAFADTTGEFAPDDRRVYSILATMQSDLGFLLGILNAPLATYLIQLSARPKAGGFFDIETQFLNPIPIPYATDAEKQDVGQRALTLQELHTLRRDMLNKLNQRLDCSQMADDKRSFDWLWSDARSASEWKKSPDVPTDLKGRALSAWAKSRAEAVLQSHLEALDTHLHPGALLTVENYADELRLLIDGVPTIEVYGQPDTSFIAAQWRQTTRSTTVTDKLTPKRLVSTLIALRTTEDDNLRQSIVDIDSNIQTIDVQIDEAEAELNRIIYLLYDLTHEDITLIEGDRWGRGQYGNGSIGQEKPLPYQE